MIAKARRAAWMAAFLLLAGCSVNDSRTALHAEKSLVGLNEVELESCLGAPDEQAAFGAVQILTYYATSTSSTSLSIPLIGGIGDSYGGYCHTIVRLQNHVVQDVRYVGETSAFGAPDAYCAPIVRGCVNHPPPALPMPPAVAAKPPAVAVKPG